MDVKALVGPPILAESEAKPVLKRASNVSPPSKIFRPSAGSEQFRKVVNFAFENMISPP